MEDKTLVRLDHETVIWILKSISDIKSDISWIKAKLKGEFIN